MAPRLEIDDELIRDLVQMLSLEQDVETQIINQQTTDDEVEVLLGQYLNQPDKSEQWLASFLNLPIHVLNALVRAADRRGMRVLSNLCTKTIADNIKRIVRECDTAPLEWTVELRARCGVEEGQQPTEGQTEKARLLVGAYALRKYMGVVDPGLTEEDEDRIMSPSFWEEKDED